MKTMLLAVTASVALVTAVQAHDDYGYGYDLYAPGYDTVIYNAPVIYTSPVLYQAAVVYNAPVFYVSSYAPPVVSVAPVDYTPVSPNVIITGGSRAGAYYLSSETTPNVLIVSHGHQKRVTPARCR